ncbi:hypothetical protein ACKGJF_002718 [Raoultella ornithinolytica]|uniref:hypothetical protein n=1 Tax=Raoultella ornithinolytica TaxID=54291 RepID=UPI001F20BD87|nr:hypothetical protein [Raoultella ornithinolytica]MCF1304985.1 hypothetical protein [Raoultella ornithinolytica]
MKKIGILLKVFSSEKYKEDFLNGNLYMNTINYFRKYEEDTKGNIGDKFEALTGWMHPHEFRLEIEFNGVKHKINPDDIVGPIITSMKIHEHANVFCMTHLHSHDIDMGNIKSEEEYELVKRYFTLPDDVRNLGEYMVVITSPMEFVDRALAEGKKLLNAKEALDYQSKQVVYYDEAEKSLLLDNMRDAPFYKQSLYEHQNEYRLCLTRDNPDDKPYVMHIGNLRDISIEIKTSEFNSMLELKRD